MCVCSHILMATLLFNAPTISPVEVVSVGKDVIYYAVNKNVMQLSLSTGKIQKLFSHKSYIIFLCMGAAHHIVKSKDGQYLYNAKFEIVYHTVLSELYMMPGDIILLEYTTFTRRLDLSTYKPTWTIVADDFAFNDAGIWARRDLAYRRFGFDGNETDQELILLDSDILCHGNLIMRKLALEISFDEHTCLVPSHVTVHWAEKSHGRYFLGYSSNDVWIPTNKAFIGLRYGRIWGRYAVSCVSNTLRIFDLHGRDHERGVLALNCYMRMLLPRDLCVMIAEYL